MNYVSVKSYAKINLSLDITGAEGGYHMIDSVVATVDLCDVISVRKRTKDDLVSCTGQGRGGELIPFEENNAVKAAERFIKTYSTCGADIAIRKNIPIGAGLGGSSADVAGVLKALAKLHSIDDKEGVKRIADGIGSDCGYMLVGGYARMYGRGDSFTPIGAGTKLDLGLLVPRTGVATAQCYKQFDLIGAKGSKASSAVHAALLKGDKAMLGRALSNDLFAPAKALNGEVEEAFNELFKFAPLGVNMTGSGSCVYALFENDEFARYAKSRYRGPHEFIITKTYLPKREES